MFWENIRPYLSSITLNIHYDHEISLKCSSFNGWKLQTAVARIFFPFFVCSAFLNALVRYCYLFHDQFMLWQLPFWGFIIKCTAYALKHGTDNSLNEMQSFFDESKYHKCEQLTFHQCNRFDHDLLGHSWGWITVSYVVNSTDAHHQFHETDSPTQ